MTTKCEKIFKRYNYPIELLTLFLCRPQVQAINESNRFESEIREEQEAKKKQAEDQKQRRAAFKKPFFFFFNHSLSD